MMVQLASTSAPEAILKDALESLDRAFKERYGKHLLRENDQALELVSRTHRFRAVEPDGLLELAKQLTQLILEPIDVDAVLAQCPPLAKGDRKPGSLKAVERFLSTLLTEGQAKQIMAPLFGLYDLRNASAHLGSSLIKSGMERLGIDERKHSTLQGAQMLDAIVGTLQIIAGTVNQPKGE